MTYEEIRDELASILCTDTVPPCDRCVDVAYRIIAKRRSVRQALIRFAREEAELHV